MFERIAGAVAAGRRFGVQVLIAAVVVGAFPIPRLQSQTADPPDALPALVQVLRQTEDAQFQLDVLKGMSEAMKGRRHVTMPAGWENVAAKLGQSPNATVRALVQSLSVSFGSERAVAALRQELMDSKADPAARRNALDSLLEVKDSGLARRLQQLLNDPPMRGAALRGLAVYEDPQTPAGIFAVYPSLDAAEKRDALNTLASRAAFARELLAVIGQGRVPAKDLSADIVRQLRNLNDAGLNQQIEKVWGVARESSADKLKEIARYKALAQVTGARPADPARGRAGFAHTCQQCHTLFGVGGKVGPDLTGSNRANLDYILQNIVDPNAIIPNDYRAWTLDLKDDRVITGIVQRQDDRSVTVVTPTETLTIPRNEITSLRQNELSMMPEGLLAGMSDDDVRDLIKYLASPVPVALTAEPGPAK
ncbi:MAG: c-type cytochrome [Limisphaerales bacterium]